MTAIVVPLVWSCSDRHVREIPLEEFFRNSEVRSYDISPDGKYLSYMAPYESRMNIFVQQAGSDSARRITSETDRDIAGYFWANNDRLLYLKDTGGDENYQLYGVNLDGSDPKAYTAIPGVRTQIIDPLEEIDSLIIVSTNQRDPQIFDPYRLNLNTGEMTLLAENPGNIQGWMTDHDGKLRVAYAIVDGVNTQILYRETEQEPFRPVLTTSFKDEVSFYVFTPDNKMVYATSNIGRDKAALVVADPATGQEVEELYANDLYDVIGLGYSKAKEKLTGAYCEGPKDVIRHFFDPQTRFMRGLDSKGRFRTPFNPFRSTHRADDYCEGNAWQYTWLVPHDVEGLIGCFGGKEAFTGKLDSLFVVSSVLEGAASPDISGLIGQYAHGNEPSHHVVYLYTMIGQPWKTADKVREILTTLYHDRPDGLSGNEDVGQMSAWYVLSSLGFYQVEPAGGRYFFGSPLFDKAEVRVRDGVLTVTAHNNSAANKYIQAVKLNGKPYTKPYIAFDDIAAGGVLEFEMGAEPAVWYEL